MVDLKHLAYMKSSEAYKIQRQVDAKRLKDIEDRVKLLREAYNSDPNNKPLRPGDEPDEWYNEIPDMTDEQIDAYEAQVAASDGFDVEEFPNAFSYTRIRPVHLNRINIKKYSAYAKMAIDTYNKEKKTNFEFVEIRKTNVEVERSKKYFITFTAKDSSESKAFQTLVLAEYDEKGRDCDVQVKFCRVKLMSSDQGKNQDDEKLKLCAGTEDAYNLLKKRRKGPSVQSQDDPVIVYCLERLGIMFEQVWTDDLNCQLQGTRQFVTLLSTELSHSIYEAITETGMVARFVEFLGWNAQPQLQLQAASALTNLAAGTSKQTQIVIEYGAVPRFVRLLDSDSEDVSEQAVWALGNVAGDNSSCRDIVLGNGAMMPLLDLLDVAESKLSMLRIATWTLSNFCCGEPLAPFELVKPALPILRQLIDLNDEEVLTNACWTLSYLSDGLKDKIQAVIEAGVCQRLVELLLHPSHTVLIPVLRAVGNIATSDDAQTQFLITRKALPSLHQLLMQNHNKRIQEEICWTISKITAGNRAQIQISSGQKLQ